VRGGPWTRRTKSPVPHEGGAYFYSSNVSGELRQDVPLKKHLRKTRQGALRLVFEGYVRSWKTGHDAARIVVEYLGKKKERVLLSFDTGETSYGRWRKVLYRSTAPAEAHFVRVRLISRKVYGKNCDGYFDALSLRAVK
jgi:hypothetical protein